MNKTVLSSLPVMLTVLEAIVNLNDSEESAPVTATISTMSPDIAFEVNVTAVVLDWV